MMNDHIADILDRKYRLALMVVALLVLGNQVLVQPYLIQLAGDAPLINLAGRQRMLSQRLAKSAMALGMGVSVETKAYVDEMSQVLDLWTSAHRQLLRYEGGPWGTGRNSAVVRDGLRGIEHHFVEMRDAARRMIQDSQADRPDLAAIREGMAVILRDESEYLRRMDRIVQIYEAEAQSRAVKLRRIGWGLTGLILASLAAIGRFIFRPAAVLIRGQVAESKRSRNELEERVRERTRALEEAGERHRALVEQLGHVARITTIGEMASGLAHELNQPLGAIANYAEGCLVELAAPRPAIDEVRHALERLLATTLRAGRIIDRIRRFVARQEPKRERFEPNRVVEEVAEILRHEAEQRRIALRLILAPDLPCVWGDPIQIQQVLVNLGRNAFDAATAQLPEPSLVLQTQRADSDTVEFAVIDQGEGIDADNLDRIFDAFFSTRADGMGIGLSICRTLIEAHHGRLMVESRPGVETVFRFTLPVGISDDGSVGSLHRG
jgi:signal transduction histidine kinase